MFHLQIHLFALNVTLSDFVYLKKFKNNNFYGLKLHLRFPPVQDIPLAAKIRK